MTQRSVLRFFLVGLPIGLALSIVVAVYLYYHPIELRFPGRAARPEAVDLLRKSPTEKDLLDYRRILTTELPAPARGSPDSLNATANWLDSTLGPTNIGLPVRAQPLGSSPDSVRNILIELPGRKATTEVIVLCTAYDNGPLGLDRAGGTALLMTVANAFVGLSQQRTVVFAFLCHDEPPAGQKSGIETLLAGLRTSRRTVRGVIDVRVSTAPKMVLGSAHIIGWSEHVNDPWGSEVWQALTARQPPMASMERLGRGKLDTKERGTPTISRLAWWRQSPPPAPFLILALDAPPDDQAAVLALARSLEGMVQALANR